MLARARVRNFTVLVLQLLSEGLSLSPRGILQSQRRLAEGERGDETGRMADAAERRK
ncbi:MAG TPA: hypothetical protein VNK52_07905 [Hyphomicrobiaceae bacterium]|nr:hypothetical protein [Hyphomicrobiaceae bacterium]